MVRPCCMNQEGSPLQTLGWPLFGSYSSPPVFQENLRFLLSTLFMVPCYKSLNRLRNPSSNSRVENGVLLHLGSLGETSLSP